MRRIINGIFRNGKGIIVFALILAFQNAIIGTAYFFPPYISIFFGVIFSFFNYAGWWSRKKMVEVIVFALILAFHIAIIGAAYFFPPYISIFFGMIFSLVNYAGWWPNKKKGEVIVFVLILAFQIAIIGTAYFVSPFISIFLGVIFCVVDYAGLWSSKKMGVSVWKFALMRKFRMYTIVYVKNNSEYHGDDCEFQDQETEEYFIDAHKASKKTGIEVEDIEKQAWTKCDDECPTYFRHASIGEALPWWISEQVIPYVAITVLLSIPAVALGSIVLIMHDKYNSIEQKNVIVLGLGSIEFDSYQEVFVSVKDLPDSYIDRPKKDNCCPVR